MFKKIFHWKTLLVSMSVISVLLVAMVFLFNSAIGEPIYSKIFPGNILVKGNIYVADHTSGNQGTTTSITGLPKLKLVALGTLTNASTETVEYLDDAEANWTAINTRVTAYAGATGDTDIYRVGASSLRLTFSSAAIAADGAVNNIADDNLENKDSIGFWIYSSDRLTAGDFYIQTVDATNNTDFDLPAISAKKWTWVEIDISGIPGGDGDDVTLINFKISATGATNLPAVDIYLDGMYAWAVADEEALSQDLVDSGVIDVILIVDGQASPNRFVQAVEYTDYFTHYESGDDFIVGIANNSTYAGLAFIAYK